MVHKPLKAVRKIQASLWAGLKVARKIPACLWAEHKTHPVGLKAGRKTMAGPRAMRKTKLAGDPQAHQKA